MKKNLSITKVGLPRRFGISLFWRWWEGKIKYIMFCQKWNFLYFYLLSILILSLNTFRLSFFLPNLKNVLVTGNLRKADKTRIGNLRKILLFSLHNLLKRSSIMCSIMTDACTVDKLPIFRNILSWQLSLFRSDNPAWLWGFPEKQIRKETFHLSPFITTR